MRLGGLILYALFFFPTIIGYVRLAFRIAFGDPAKCKEAMRAIDQFNNAEWLNGLGRETVSSHSWRARGAWWADFVIRLTDKIQAGHCQESNRHEQPIVNFINNQK